MKSKVGVIAKREYIVGIKKWGFWLVTLGLPLLIFIIGLFSLVLGVYTGSRVADKEEETSRELGILDEASLLDWASLNETGPKTSIDPAIAAVLEQMDLPAGLRGKIEEAVTKSEWNRSLNYTVFQDLETARAALKADQLRGLLVFPTDFLTNYQATLHLPNEDSDRFSMRMVSSDLRDAILSRKFEEGEIDQILKPLAGLETVYLEKGKEKKESAPFELTRYVLPALFMFIMMLAILTSVDRLLRGLAEEKSNRVIEVLLSSTTAEQLMAGKVLGLGLLGLTQLAIWACLALVPIALLFTFIRLDPVSMMVFAIFFVLGYFLTAVMTLALGSLGSNLQEASQYSAVVILLSIMPTWTFPLIISEPSGLLARIFTFFPFTTPLVVVLRQAAGEIPTWELLTSILVMLAALFLAVKVGARIFRIGILLTGKPLGPRALWRALSQA